MVVEMMVRPSFQPGPARAKGVAMRRHMHALVAKIADEKTGKADGTGQAPKQKTHASNHRDEQTTFQERIDEILRIFRVVVMKTMVIPSAESTPDRGVQDKAVKRILEQSPGDEASEPAQRDRPRLQVKAGHERKRGRHAPIEKRREAKKLRAVGTAFLWTLIHSSCGEKNA